MLRCGLPTEKESNQGVWVEFESTWNILGCVTRTAGQGVIACQQTCQHNNGHRDDYSYSMSANFFPADVSNAVCSNRERSNWKDRM